MARAYGNPYVLQTCAICGSSNRLPDWIGTHETAQGDWLECPAKAVMQPETPPDQGT